MGWFEDLIRGIIGGTNKNESSKTSDYSSQNSSASDSSSAGQTAYDNARKAGASSGRARHMAQQADIQAGNAPKTGFGYDSDYIISNPAGRQTASNYQIDAAMNTLRQRGSDVSEPQAFNDFSNWASEKKSKNDEKEYYRDRNRNWLHTALDDNLGTEGIGGFANEMIGYSPIGIAADTFFPDWAYNPTEDNGVESALNPAFFEGDYSMPSGELMQRLDKDEQERWQRETGDLLGKDLTAMAMFNPGGQEAAAIGRGGLKPVLEMAKRNKGTTKAQRRAIQEQMEAAKNEAAKTAGKQVEEKAAKSNFENVVNGAVPNQVRYYGPAFGRQPIKPTKGKPISEAAKDIVTEPRYRGGVQGRGIYGPQPYMPNSSPAARAINAERLASASGNKRAFESLLEKAVGKKQPTAEEVVSNAENIPAAAAKAEEVATPNWSNAIRGARKDIEEGAKDTVSASNKFKQYTKQQEEAEKAIAKATTDEERQKAMQELADISKKKVELAEKNPDVMAELLVDSRKRGDIRAEKLQPGQEKNLQNKFDRILNKATSSERFSGDEGDLIDFFGQEAFDRMNKLSPQASDFISQRFASELDSVGKPTKSMLEDMLTATEKAEARASKLSNRYKWGAGGAMLVPAGVLGGITAKETYDSLKQSGLAIANGIGLDENGNITWQPAPDKTTEEAIEEVADAGVAITEEGEMVFGVTQEQWDSMTQREQYQVAQADQAFKQFLKDTQNENYIGDYGYEGWRDLAAGGDKRAAIAAMLGYTYDGDYELPGWQKRWEDSGVDFSGDPDQDIENVYQYMWGEDNVIDPNRWFDEGEGYQANHNLSIDDETAFRLGEYIQDTAGIDFSEMTDANGDLIFPEGYDNKDIAALLMYQNDILNNLGDMKDWDQEDLDNLSKIFAETGDTRKYTFDDNSDIEWKASKRYGWNPWWSAFNGEGKFPIALYDDYDVENTIDENLPEAYMKAIENQTGRKIGRS